MTSQSERLRALPSVGSLLQQDEIKTLCTQHGVGRVTNIVRELVKEAREKVLKGEAAQSISPAQISKKMAMPTSLRPVINATGVVVHTNLGRAPMNDEVCRAITQVAGQYSTLEYSLEKAGRGSRHDHAKTLLMELTGAEDACVVNNNAAAVMIALAALAPEREVVVSRGELVEIGGSFRVPDIMELSGAKLVEVGTTNRTRIADYRKATTNETSLWMKVHRSNFALIGFTEDAGLIELAKEHERPDLMYDAGSGCLLPVSADPREKPVRTLIEAGVDLVTFSGDKLLGGPQAGLIVGKARLVEKIRRHPMMRALRPDKLCLAGLCETLRLWRDDPERIRVRAMIDAHPKAVQALEIRAEKMVLELRQGGVTCEVVKTRNRVGGGTAPDVTLEGRALSFAGDAEDILLSWRSMKTPLIGRAADKNALLELRTVAPSEDKAVLAALLALT